jgi:hypothetical protein
MTRACKTLPPVSAQPEPWLPLYKAAVALGESRQTVLTRALFGELEHDRRGRIIYISRKSIDRVLAARGP